ncbi:MAG: 16S rRNA processing protein RimM [Bacteroidales bacterium]|nr:16S rRNA processing protein RimM [Bacteroidales bacterium]
MADKNFYYLGTLTKPFGLKGELCAFFDVDDCERYLDLTSVFIETDGEMLPYMIENLQYRGNNQFVVKLQDVDMDNVREFVQTDLYLPLSSLPKLTGNRFYFHEVIGFQVIDDRLGVIGTCKDFMELANNPLMQVDHDGAEILIPASSQFVTKVDRDNKVLHVSTPDGLVDLYLK